LRKAKILNSFKGPKVRQFRELFFAANPAVNWKHQIQEGLMQQESRGKWLMIGGSVTVVAILVGILKSGHVQTWLKSQKPEEVPVPKTAQTETVDESAYQMVIKGRLKEVQACYNAELKKGLEIRAGKLVVKWTVTPEGKAGDFLEEQNEMNSSSLYECATKAIAAWPFPKNQTFMVRYTFKMRELEKPVLARKAASTREAAPDGIRDEVKEQLGEM
jgi:hypothetical protein